MKWILAALLVFSAALGGGVYLLSSTGRGTGIEVDWRLLGQMDYMSNKATTELQELNGKQIKIPGFMVPLEDNDRKVTEFLLVPSPQACIHVPPPPPNQMVYVKMKKGVNAAVGAPIWVYGEFKISTKRSQYGEVSFELAGDEVEAYH
ncbi:MAG: DUF3299 domain-containing protein [Bdellovibrio sp.]|nr:DUF3299 domain-containing protein [Bdellovibrio sp.]